MYAEVLPEADTRVTDVRNGGHFTPPVRGPDASARP